MGNAGTNVQSPYIHGNYKNPHCFYIHLIKKKWRKTSKTTELAGKSISANIALYTWKLQKEKLFNKHWRKPPNAHANYKNHNCF